MASVLDSWQNGFAFGDNLVFLLIDENQLSLKELFLINFISDVFSDNGCTSITVWGDLTPDTDPAMDGRPIVAKNSDFATGLSFGNHIGKLASMHAVHYIKNQGAKKDIVSIGYLGCLLLSEKGMNPNGLFIGENTSQYTEDHYRSEGKDSVSASMRKCLESFDSITDASDYMINGRSYTHGTNITMVDRNEALIVESSYLGSHVREYDETSLKPNLVTYLDSEVSTDWDHTVFEGPVLAATNCFQLSVHPENLWESSTNRLGTVTDMITAMDDDGTITVEELKSILSSGVEGGGPSNVFREDILSTIQSTIYDPRKQTVKIHFAPYPTVVKKPALPDYKIGRAHV
jgi:hypothetical protein